MDYDDALKLVGQCGPYQISLLLLIFFTKIPNMWDSLSIIFIKGIPEYWCATPELNHLNLTEDVIRNLTIPLVEKDGVPVYSSCKMYARNYSDWTRDDVWESISSSENMSYIIPCRNGWIYDRSIYTSTIVTEWDLVCDNRWLQPVAVAINRAGSLIGMIVFATISDMFGRKISLYLGAVTDIALGFAIAFSPNYIAFLAIRFCWSIMGASFFSTMFVVVMELVGPSHREAASSMTMYASSIGYVLYAALAYCIRDWFTLQLASTAPSVLIILLLVFVPESVRWLLVNRKHGRAEQILRKVAKRNKKEFPEELEITMETQKHKRYLLDMCHSKRMTLVSLNICYIWFAIGIVFITLVLNSSNLGGNHYINFAIAGAVEFPGYLLAQIGMTFFGRRRSICVFFFIGGISLLCALAVPTDMNWLFITLNMIGKCCATGVVGIIFVFTTELFPTVIRSTGLTAGLWFARIAGILAPFIVQAADISKYIPCMVCGALCFSAGLLVLCLPETKGIKLPDTLAEAEGISKKEVGNQKGVNKQNTEERKSETTQELQSLTSL